MTDSNAFFDLSVVIPVHNEARRLPRTLDCLAEFASGRHLRLEVVVADDRSTDGTAQVAQSLAAHLPIHLHVLHTPSGVAQAVRAGMLAARGRRLLYCDADGAVPFDDLMPLWQALDRGFHVAVGSRKMVHDSVEIAQPWHRIAMGRAWSAMVRNAVPTGVQDTQCGFKLFTCDAAQALFAPLTSRSFVFHVEVLARARRLGLRVAELPVRWRDVRGSKIRLIKDPAAMALELASLALRQAQHTNTVFYGDLR